MALFQCNITIIADEVYVFVVKILMYHTINKELVILIKIDTFEIKGYTAYYPYLHKSYLNFGLKYLP